VKTAGIIGGLGPESTLDYYRRLIDCYRARAGEDHAPSLVIDSVDLPKVVELVRGDRRAELVVYLAAEIGRLARAGADFAVVAANTPHLVFDDLQRISPLPLISIVEATGRAAAARGLSRLGLFGTRFTMHGRFYPEVFERLGIALVMPAAAEQDYVHDIYMGELVRGTVRDETRGELVAIARRMKSRDGIEGLVLGGTELSLILSAGDLPEMAVLDTAQIHVEEIVTALLA
jgi:aspartate racemase